MNIFFKFLISLILFLNYPINSFSIENKILFKINNKIITSIDILNEAKYLGFINKGLSELSRDQIYEISKNSIIKDRIKEIEIKKNNKNLNIDKNYIDEIMLKYFQKFNLNSINEIHNIIKKNDLNLEAIQNKFIIQIMWNELIFKKYFKNIKIDKNLIKQEISKKKIKEEYLISEIVYNVKDNQDIKLHSQKIIDAINENGFKKAAILHSQSDTAINGGNIGWINKNSLSKKIRKELEKIKIGKITTPIQIPGAFIILKIENKRTSVIELNTEEELNKIVKAQTNEQLNQFSNIYFNRIKKILELMNYKPIIIVAGEPKSIFLKYFSNH